MKFSQRTKALVIAVLTAGALLAITRQARADEFCFVCAIWGPSNPLYWFFGCDTSCPASATPVRK